MLKWAIEISQFDLEYKSRSAMKAQALVDFIPKFSIEKYEDPTILIVVSRLMPQAEKA